MTTVEAGIKTFLIADGRGAVWPVRLAAWKAKACAVANRNFTRDERGSFLGNRSYPRICPNSPVPSS
jgi:hypothetical protein